MVGTWWLTGDSPHRTRRLPITPLYGSWLGGLGGHARWGAHAHWGGHACWLSGCACGGGGEGVAPEVGVRDLHSHGGPSPKRILRASASVAACHPATVARFFVVQWSDIRSVGTPLT